MLLVDGPRFDGGWDPFEALDDALAELRGSPAVAYAAISAVVETKAAPARSTSLIGGAAARGWRFLRAR